jgi:hypothetical protein
LTFLYTSFIKKPLFPRKREYGDLTREKGKEKKVIMPENRMGNSGE